MDSLLPTVNTMSPPSTPDFEIPRRGDLIAGKYQIEEFLGAGGMGAVVGARHLDLRQRVAVKFLLPSAVRLPDAIARFLREARAAAAIRSEHVTRVLDVGTLETGAPYMVMERLDGMDLARLLKARGRFPVTEAVDFLLQASEAIAEAHALSIVHRDLKPGNLFVTRRSDGSPLVKVLDFGLSKMDEEASEMSLTAASLVVGSPHYMSPEQIRSLKCVDTRTDIWALGVILYELVTGQRPFQGPSLSAVYASIIADTPTPVHVLRPDVPETLDIIVRSCLERNVNQRTQSVAELARALGPLAAPPSIPSVERIVRVGGSTATTMLSDDDLEVVSVDPPPGQPTAPREVTLPSPPILPAAPPTLPIPMVAPPPLPPSAPGPSSATLQMQAWARTGQIAQRHPLSPIMLGVSIAIAGAGLLVALAPSGTRLAGARLGTAALQQGIASAPNVTEVATAAPSVSARVAKPAPQASSETHSSPPEAPTPVEVPTTSSKAEPVAAPPLKSTERRRPAPAPSAAAPAVPMSGYSPPKIDAKILNRLE